MKRYRFRLLAGTIHTARVAVATLTLVRVGHYWRVTITPYAWRHHAWQAARGHMSGVGWTETDALLEAYHRWRPETLIGGV